MESLKIIFWERKVIIPLALIFLGIATCCGSTVGFTSVPQLDTNAKVMYDPNTKVINGWVETDGVRNSRNEPAMTLWFYLSDNRQAITARIGETRIDVDK